LHLVFILADMTPNPFSVWLIKHHYYYFSVHLKLIFCPQQHGLTLINMV